MLTTTPYSYWPLSTYLLCDYVGYPFTPGRKTLTNSLQAWGFGVMTLKTEESIPNFDSYKLFKPLFNNQDPSQASDAECCVCIFLKALYEHLKEGLKDQLPKGRT
ncbi:hypothetical protein F5Y09DRAFT_308068 [Xylaria sp. FL1042]|nr:hypothetical protein F5Y09DRAFT_308068 [Xylaria sp. FL1042]